MAAEVLLMVTGSAWFAGFVSDMLLEAVINSDQPPRLVRYLPFGQIFAIVNTAAQDPRVRRVMNKALLDTNGLGDRIFSSLMY